MGHFADISADLANVCFRANGARGLICIKGVAAIRWGPRADS
jgi:hypothetical protein